LIVCYAHEVEKFDDIETIDDYNSPQPRWKAERQRAQYTRATRGSADATILPVDMRAVSGNVSF
jgi:hypothetical protein